MILNNDDKGDGAGAQGEAPPAYDDLVEVGRDSGGMEYSGDRKGAGGGGGAAVCVTVQPQPGPSSPPAGSSTSHGRNKTWFSWFSEKDARAEMKRTIQSLMRDVVKESASPAAVSVLQSCLEACQSRGLSFQSIVSERFIEGHCPLYWAILKRPCTPSEREGEANDRVQLLDILLSIPLDSTTRSEAYLACMLSSDQVLFQRLRRVPGHPSPSISAAHELLLGDAPEDDVRSFDGDADCGEFRLTWRIVKFQKRMRALGGVGTEVIARGRIWSLAFLVLPRDVHVGRQQVKMGTWVASVSLLAPSPATYLDAQILIPEATTEVRSIVPWTSGTQKGTQKPPITLQVKTDAEQLEALAVRTMKQDLRDHVLSQPGSRTLIVPLSEHANGDGLQFDGCSYVQRDGSLDVIFDGRLRRTGGDCIIG